MKGNVTVRWVLYGAAAGVTALLLAIEVMALLPLPAHTVGLDAVLVAERGRDRSGLAAYRCTLGAHRGDSLAYTENTLDAVRSARHDPRYAFIECDVQYSADGKAVVFHDQRLLRVFGSWAKVGALTYDELRAATGGEIATYEEVMQAASGKRLNIEIKSQGDLAEDSRLVDFVVADVTARGIRDDILISSISGDVVRYVAARYPHMALGQVFWIRASTYLHLDFLTRHLYEQMQASQADYLLLHVANLRNIGDLLRLKPRGKTIVFWDFDDAMYLVHKDLSDRLWGDALARTFLAQCRYRLRRALSPDGGSAGM